ncbi:MAG TPA: hypothetical protein VEX38_01130 [Fimbriimonadaceae bacterium]|nr:hypothetical protein [Fimbriimonadaceae bacterium]
MSLARLGLSLAAAAGLVSVGKPISFNEVKLVDAYERVGPRTFTDTLVNNEHTTAEYTNRHVFALVFKRADENGSWTGPDYAPVTGTEYVTGVTPEELGVTFGTNLLHDMYITVLPPGELISFGSEKPANYAVLSSAGPRVHGMTLPIRQGQKVQVCLGSSGALSGGTIHFVLWYLVPRYDSNNVRIGYDISYEKRTYNIYKRWCDDASVDSRKMFGQPNVDGQWPGDPNAEKQNVNFGAWTWRGGLFIGNMPWQTGDQSGTARIQLYPQGLSNWSFDGDLQMLVASLYDLGKPPGLTVATTEVQLRVPSSTDSYFNSAEATVNWSSKWTTGNPTQEETFTSTQALNYANWKVPWNLADPISPLKFYLQLKDEEDAISNQTVTWRYFGSREFQSAFPNVFPANDSAPRLWVVSEEEREVYQAYNQQPPAELVSLFLGVLL